MQYVRTAVLGMLMLSLTTLCFGQDLTPEMLGFNQVTLQHDQWGEINYYLSTTEDDTPKPMIIYMDGSGSFPLYQKSNGGIGTTVVLDTRELSQTHRIVLISKPGVPFLDEVIDDPETGRPEYDEPTIYTQRMSETWRVNTASMVIDDILKKEAIDKSRILLLGFSEGAQVGPHIAAMNSNITHLILFGGNGLNHFYDPLISARYKAETGELSHQQAQAEVDSLFNVYRDIYAKPESTTDFWYGHTYKRWASFGQKPPVAALTELDIPIYIASGSRDENPILSADFIQLEFIRLGKENLTYKIYPDYDHQFNKLDIRDGEFKGAENMLDKVMKDAFTWYSNH